MNTVAFAKCMRRQREFCGLTVEQLGEQTGIDVQRLNYLEAGTERPRTSELISIAEALDVPPLVLMGGGGTIHIRGRDEDGKPTDEWKTY